MFPPLFAELNRRRVFRALIAYGIAAFAVLQVIEPIMHGLHWPDAVLSYVVVALALGFPVVVALAWAFDVKDGSIARALPAASAGLRGPRLRLVLIGIGVLAAAPGVIWYFVLRSRPAALSSEEALRARLDAVPPASDIRAAPSIAVLPLVNMSSDSSAPTSSRTGPAPALISNGRSRSALTAPTSWVSTRGSSAQSDA